VSLADEEHRRESMIMPHDPLSAKRAQKSLVGLVLTHAHDDLFGAIIESVAQAEVPIDATKSAPFVRGEMQFGGVTPPKIRCGVAWARPRRFSVRSASNSYRWLHRLPESHALAIHTRPERCCTPAIGDRSDPIIGVPPNERRLSELGEARSGGAGRGFHQGTGCGRASRGE